LSFTIHHGDALAVLRKMPDESVNMCVTSPPYWGLRDYGVDGQLGLERTPEEYVSSMVAVFHEVRRVLRNDGTCWINIGDSYATGGMSNPSGKSTLGGGKDRGAAMYSISRARPDALKPKDLVGIPWRLAFGLQADGWYLRSDIIWHKPNPMPESVTDRPTKSHEYLFLLSKSERYFYDGDAIKEPGKLGRSGNTQHKYVNGQQLHRSKSGFLKMRQKVYELVSKRTVWTIQSLPTPDAHFATFPIELPETCIRAGCPLDGVVLDPFSGAATTGLAALKNGRRYVGIELNPEYIKISHVRARRHYPLLVSDLPA
jgi:DNA modification methylase